MYQGCTAMLPNYCVQPTAGARRFADGVLSIARRG
jgi:hypothetical protein